MPSVCATAVPREEKEEEYGRRDIGLATGKPVLVQAQSRTRWINGAGVLGLLVVTAILVLSLYFIARYLL